MNDDVPEMDPDWAKARYDALYAIPDGGWAKIDGDWYCRPPGSPIPAANLAGHDVTEHGDGTITASPSILYSVEHYGYTYHGYLERGVWREC